MSERVTFSVPGMTCGHCEAAIQHEIGGVEGVDSIEVDLKLKTVLVVGLGFDRSQLVEAIDEAGFDVA